MAEQLSNPEERKQGPEYEIDQLVLLNEVVQEMYDTAISGEPWMVSDVALDVISNLACAMTRRQGLEFGRTLVQKLYERADNRGEEAPDTNQGWRHDELARQVDHEVVAMRLQRADPAEGPSAQPIPPDAPTS